MLSLYHKYYMSNRIQYISTTHTSKAEAKEHKSKCNTLHNIYYKEMEFDEIADLLDQGVSIGRVGCKTSFVMIDIDHTTINIATVIDAYKGNPDISVSYSSSNNACKYHILVNIHREVTVDEYGAAVSEEFQKIHDKLCTSRGNFMEIDQASYKFYQCFFGPSVDNVTEIVLEGSTRLFCWTKKNEDIRAYIDDYERKLLPTMNSAMYCKRNGLLTVKETEGRYDVYMPAMSKFGKKIPSGSRYNWSLRIGWQILVRVLYLNYYFKENWNGVDFIDTFKWAVRSNVYNSDEFTKSSDYKSLLLYFDNKWDIWHSRPFSQAVQEIDCKLKSPGRQYKARRYNSVAIDEIVMEHRFCANGGGPEIVFEDKEELKAICKDRLLDYYDTLKRIKEMGYEVRFRTESRRKNCIDRYVVYGNVVRIPRSEVTKTMKDYCSRHGLQIERI